MKIKEVLNQRPVISGQSRRFGLGTTGSTVGKDVCILEFLGLHITLIENTRTGDTLASVIGIDEQGLPFNLTVSFEDLVSTIEDIFCE